MNNALWRVRQIHTGSLLTLHTMLILSVGMNVWFAAQISNMGGPSLRSGGTAVGGHLDGGVEFRTLDGALDHYDFRMAAKPTILYVMSPQCGWCQQNEENVRTLYSSTKEHFNFFVMGITDDGLAAYVKSSPYESVVRIIDPTVVPPALDLFATPQTILINQQGIIERVWVGAYMNEKQTEIEDFFQIYLPGLRDMS
ncbi:MAG: hypothetical protein OXN90_03350 [Gemmatimonadota bacterium]|nr:hypothetical protein [Gemmatimonadota bacterium]